MVDLKISVIDFKRNPIRTVWTRGMLFSYVPDLYKPCCAKHFLPYITKMNKELGYEEFDTSRIFDNAMPGRKAAFISNRGLSELIRVLLLEEEFIEKNKGFLKASQECYNYLIAEEKEIKKDNVENHDYLVTPVQAQKEEPENKEIDLEHEKLLSFVNSTLECSIRMAIIDEKPWFVAKDVCDSLGYKNSRDALYRHVREKQKGVVKTDTLGGTQTLSVINEAGLWILVLKSGVKNAEKIQDWISEEVIPSIRKTGSYGQPKLDLDNPDTVLALTQDWHKTKKQVLELENKIQEDEPKVKLGEAMMESDNTYTFRFVAMIMSQMGVDMGERKLANHFIEKHFMSRKLGKETHHRTCVKGRRNGLVKIVNKNGTLITMVTGKGLEYLCKTFSLDKNKMEEKIEQEKTVL